MARDTKAEYRARVAKGALEGKRPSDAAGHAKRSKASTARVPRESTITKGRRKVEVVQSSDRRYLQKRIREAASKGRNVQIYGTWDTDLGYRTQVAGGKQHGHSATRTGDRAVGKLRLLIGTASTLAAVTGAPGVAAARVISDRLKRDPETGARVFDTFDDYLGDWWDSEPTFDDGDTP